MERSPICRLACCGTSPQVAEDGGLLRCVPLHILSSYRASSGQSRGTRTVLGGPHRTPSRAPGGGRHRLGEPQSLYREISELASPHLYAQAPGVYSRACESERVRGIPG